MIYGIENEPVVATLNKEHLLTLPDVKAVTIQKVSLIVDIDSNYNSSLPKW